VCSVLDQCAVCWISVQCAGSVCSVLDQCAVCWMCVWCVYVTNDVCVTALHINYCELQSHYVSSHINRLTNYSHTKGGNFLLLV